MIENRTLKQLKEIIKATLFISGEGVDISAFAEKFDIKKEKVEKMYEEIKEELGKDNGIQIIKYNNKIQLASNPEYASDIAEILNPIRERNLTKAALETLAIIAYKQPITKLEIEEIRGVGCDYTVQMLLEHNMIEVVGRKDVVGRPLLLGTTETFLKRFSLTSLEDLPDNEELKERIRVIYNQQDSDSLYRDFTLPEDEIVPDFLQNENVETFEAEIADESLIVDNTELNNHEELTAEELVEAELTESELDDKMETLSELAGQDNTVSDNIVV